MYKNTKFRRKKDAHFVELKWTLDKIIMPSKETVEVFEELKKGRCSLNDCFVKELVKITSVDYVHDK